MAFSIFSSDSRGPRLGENFKRNNSSGNGNLNPKNILVFLVILLVCILTYKVLQPLDDEEVGRDEPAKPKLITFNDNYQGKGGEVFSVITFSLKLDLSKRIYLEQNKKNRKIEGLLNKIKSDGLAFLPVDTSLFDKNKSDFFAITCAMYEDSDNLPPGLLIANGRNFKNINKKNGPGNFYLKPNGIFSVSKAGKIQIVETSKYVSGGEQFALQSGPMIIEDNQVNYFPSDSDNKRKRSAIGISGDNLVFVSTKSKVSFYQLAEFMKTKLKCKNALHLESDYFSFMEFPGSTLKYEVDPNVIR
jgi:uncharacterized protein YigE (DUF2233 family)